MNTEPVQKPISLEAFLPGEVEILKSFLKTKLLRYIPGESNDDKVILELLPPMNENETVDEYRRRLSIIQQLAIFLERCNLPLIERNVKMVGQLDSATRGLDVKIREYTFKDFLTLLRLIDIELSARDVLQFKPVVIQEGNDL